MTTRLASFTTTALFTALGAFAGCADNASSDGTNDSADAISAPETAATTSSVEGVIVTTAPITSTDAVTLAAAFRAQFVANGQACVTIDSDQQTYVHVTFACAGPLATTGTLALAITSATSVDATADLTIGGAAVNGTYTIDLPLAASQPRTMTGTLTIAGPRRDLDATADASWTVDGACVTYSADGEITAAGPSGTAQASYAVDAKTVCR